MKLTSDDIQKLRSSQTTKMDLSSRGLTDKDLIKIRNHIPKDGLFTELDLSYNSFTDACITSEFLTFISEHPFLAKITLKGNQLSESKERLVKNVLRGKFNSPQVGSKPLPIAGMPTSPSLSMQFFSKTPPKNTSRTPPQIHRTGSDAVDEGAHIGRVSSLPVGGTITPEYCSIGSPAFPIAGSSRMSSMSSEEIERDTGISDKIASFLKALRHLLGNDLELLSIRVEEGIEYSEELRTKLKGDQEEINASDLDFLIERYTSIRKNMKNISRVFHSVSQLTQVVNGEISIELKRFSPIELVESVCKVERAEAKKKNIDFKVSMPVSQTRLNGGRDWLRSCLQELLSSAITHTAENGSIDVILSLEPQKYKRFNSIPMSITVKNTGVRFTKEDINRFKNADIDDYFNENFSEEAMTLLRVREMMNIMKGKMTIAIEDDKTCISLGVELDSVQKQKKKRKIESYKFSCKPEEKTILIVDDEQSIRHAMQKRLEKLGFTVVTAINGQEAVQVVSEYKKEKNIIFDLILMDMQMPVMTGTEATRAIKEIPEYKDVPVGLVSANIQDIEEQDKSLFAFTLEKPINPNRLFVAMDEVMSTPIQRLSPRIH